MARKALGTTLLLLVLCVASVAADPTPAPAHSPLDGTAIAACPCPEAAEPGVIWRGSESLGLGEIARRAAPVLWFSRDEPLLKREGGVIPQAHPCDAPAASPVVYYQVTRIAYRGETKVTLPAEEDPDFFGKVDRMVLKYFFYYPEDFGLGGHLHDLEALELDVELRSESGCHQVRIVTASGLAHGNRWYSNTLEITDDTKFPLTIFVEEGKHGSCPDRNADGYFTRGYDVNHTVNDAWGVRDIMGSGVLLSSAYSSEMTKPRRFEDRLLPPESELSCVSDDHSSLQVGEGYLGRYELRPGDRVPRCADIGEGRERLYTFMDYQSFGEQHPPAQYPAESLESALRHLKSPDSFVSVSLRTEGDLGLGLVFRGLDLRQGWVVPKLNVNAFSASAGLMYTPSASRFFDYYLAGGLRRQFKPRRETVGIDTPDGPREIEVVRPPEWKFYSEIGVKIRAEVPSKVRPFVLGYHFGGLRIGVQALGVGKLDDIRLIFEVGAGAW